MKRLYLNIFLILIFIFLFSFKFTKLVSFFSVNKSIFSEIRIISRISGGEFIELSNPNKFEINLTDTKMIKIEDQNSISVFLSKSPNLIFAGDKERAWKEFFKDFEKLS